MSGSMADEIVTLRGELREEKEYAAALEESKADAERILSKKIGELVEARRALKLSDPGDLYAAATQLELTNEPPSETVPTCRYLRDLADRISAALPHSPTEGVEAG